MKQLLLMDAKDYSVDMGEICRTAVRGIIFIGGRLLLIESSTGELKLPGGGQEDGEDDMTTLLREVNEETGYFVKPESVIPFGVIEEKRKSISEEMIWHQTSRLYFCEVGTQRTETNYSENEKKCGMRFGTYTLDEAIEQNRRMLDYDGVKAWNRREYETLLLIKEHMDNA